jgi:hypothetical protein
VSVTETPVIPDTTPETVYPELVLVLVPLLVPLVVPAPVELLGCVAALLVDDVELPLSLHAANDMQARKISAVDKRVGRIMEVPLSQALLTGTCFMGKQPSTQSVAETRPLSVLGNMANA